MDQLQDILKGCKNNDRNSQEKLYYRFYPALNALCKKFFEDEHDIQTALNNGMMKVFKNISRYDSSKGDLFNWIYTIVRNSALTIIRDKKPEMTQELKENMSEVADQDPFVNSEWVDIFSYLDRLPPATRAVCSLFYLEGYSIKEISTDLTMKDGTVKWHLNESRNRLRDIFNKETKQ